MNKTARQLDPIEVYKAFIEHYISLNTFEWSMIKNKLEVITYQRGEIIHHMGDTCQYNYFLNSGIVRSYMLDTRGKDYTWGIHFNDKTAKMHNLFVVDYQSFINQIPSTLGFEVIEPCELVRISYKNVEFVYKHFKKWEYFGRKMTEIAYSEAHKMIVERMTLNATERLERFMQNESFLIDKVPQYHIASYLGITAQSLSKLKKELQNHKS